jgi:hypothetical protein
MGQLLLYFGGYLGVMLAGSLVTRFGKILNWSAAATLEYHASGEELHARLRHFRLLGNTFALAGIAAVMVLHVSGQDYAWSLLGAGLVAVATHNLHRSLNRL